MRLSNLHTHTTFSDGVSSPRETAQSAVKKGFASLGFSDHSEDLFDPSFHPSPGKDLPYRTAIEELKREYEGTLPIFCGIEKDYYTREDLSPYDFVIGSVHYLAWEGEYIPLDVTENIQRDWIWKHGRGDRNELARRYYDLVAANAATGNFQIQGHFDLINKFGLFDENDEVYQKIALEALDEVLKRIPYIEINTGAVARGYRKVPYPDALFLRYIREKDGKMVISSDAHSSDTLDFYFPESRSLLKESGFSSCWQLEKGAFQEVDL